MFTVTKRYQDLPAAHRQPNHPGHCRLIHGHNWAFDITFTAKEKDACGFVIDVGGLKPLKEALESKFDHQLLLNREDPELDRYAQDRFCRLTIVEDCSMEGLAELVFYLAQEVCNAFEQNRDLKVVRVTCWEDSKNCATYEPKR